MGLGVALFGWITYEYVRRGWDLPSPFPGDPGFSLVLLCKDQGELLEYGVRKLRSIMDRAGVVRGQVILADIGSEDDTAVVSLRLAETLRGVDAVATEDSTARGWAEVLVTAHRRALYPLVLCYAPDDNCGWEMTCDLLEAFLQAGQTRPTGNETSGTDPSREGPS